MTIMNYGKNDPATFTLQSGGIGGRRRGAFRYAVLMGMALVVVLGLKLMLPTPSFASEGEVTTTIQTIGGIDINYSHGDSVDVYYAPPLLDVTVTHPIGNAPSTTTVLRGDIGGEDIDVGADILQGGNGNFSFTSVANIDDVNYGIDIRRSGEGEFNIVSSGSITNISNIGIRASRIGEGDINIDLSGEVSIGSSSAGDAIRMSGNGTKALTLRPGFSLDGEVIASGEGTGILKLGPSISGSDSGTLALGSAEYGFSGFSAFEKTDDTTLWEVTGTADEGEVFTSAVVESGTLRFSGATFKMSGTDEFKLKKKAILEVVGDNNLTGNLSNGGDIVFAPEVPSDSLSEGASDDSLTVTGDYTGRGELIFYIGSDGWQNDKLTIEGNIEGGGHNWHVSALVPEGQTAPSITTNSPALIEVKGEADENDFYSNAVVVGISVYALDHEEDADGTDKWHFAYQDEVPTAHLSPSVVDDTVELTAVGQDSNDNDPSGISFRSGAREHAGGPWAKRQSSPASLESGAIAGSHSRIHDDRIHFGFDLPAADLMGGDVIVRASMWQGLSISDTSTSTGGGVIGIDSHAAALGASWWSPNGFYVDGRARYVRFSTDISAEGLLLAQDNKGAGMSASAEAGYRFAVLPLGMVDLHVAPQMQLIWSRVGFDDFVGPYGELVSLEDGDLATGRLGLSWDGEWRAAEGSGHVYGGVSLHTALDGRTAVNVSGVSIASERNDLSIHGRLGVSYEWDDGYAVHSEAVALRRDDADEIRANLGVRINF